MQSDFDKFFLEAEKWKRQPVSFISNGIFRKGILEDIRVYNRLSSHQGKAIEARLAVLDVRVPGEKPKPWELDRTLWQLQCNFSQPHARLVRTLLGNILFRSGSIAGLVELTNQDRQLTAEPPIR
ncbi:MAG: hypothetical protein WC813_01405 [Patescibacteria group bacterium]|jgi:hypothetical protein